MRWDAKRTGAMTEQRPRATYKDLLESVRAEPFEAVASALPELWGER
jgi:hypothetical protein